MNTDTTIMPSSLEDLADLIRRIIKQENQEQQTASKDRFLSPREVCKLFEPNISLRTLLKWSKRGCLIRHQLGGVTFYKLSEIMEAINTSKVE